MQNETKKDIDKKQLRKEILQLRKAMEKKLWQDKSRQIEGRLTAQSVFQQAEYILCYVNYKNEVETISLLEESLRLGKRVYCPRVSDGDMEFYEIFSLSDLEDGFRGILEPKALEERIFRLQEDVPTLMIMPGAVFDKMCHRIGYGGGYYDRYLASLGLDSENSAHVLDFFHTVALAFSFQLLEEDIPYEEYDICPQIIITEQEIIEKN